MRKILLIAVFFGFQIQNANAALITLGSTVTGSQYQTEFSLNYDDVNNDLTLTMAEMTNIDWILTKISDSSVFTGSSTATGLGSGGIDFTVTALEELVSSTIGNFSFSTTFGSLGIQNFTGTDISYYNSCSVSPCSSGYSYDTFDVSIAAVPEPSIIALFAAGLFGLGFARRRKA